jgi:hypothetical protein
MFFAALVCRGCYLFKVTPLGHLSLQQREPWCCAGKAERVSKRQCLGQGCSGLFLVLGSVCGSGEEAEAAEVGLGPAGLVLDHALERFEGERIAGAMERHGHAPAIGVTVPLVAACLGTEEKAVANEGGNQLPSRQTAQLAVVNGHRSEGDGYQRLLRHLHVFGNWVAVFEQFLNHHLDDFLDMLECFLLSIAPRGRAVGLQGRAMG